MTLDISAIKERAEEAKRVAGATYPGPWKVGLGGGVVPVNACDLAYDRDEMDASVDTFIVHARNNIPQLADDVLALVEHINDLSKLLKCFIDDNVHYESRKEAFKIAKTALRESQ